MAIEIKYELGNHKGKDVIYIHFERNLEMNQRVKKLVGVKWSNSKKAWYVLDSAFYRAKFKLLPKTPIGKEVLSQIHDINKPSLNKFVETLQLKAYSPNTITTYRNEFAQLLYILKDKNVDDLTTERIRDYFQYCIIKLNLSENTLHSRINAVKFYFEKVLYRERFFFEIPRPKKPLRLPNVLAISQVEKLF
jgi:integrase/recombinase XerD